ncbi:aldehyde dehydrogenase family protein [Sphingomonas liriopis]|nr:aldehyde dehydrogenase family protein [Sphingomonas liriopis]
MNDPMSDDAAMLIGGAAVFADERLAVVDPATEAIVAHVPDASPGDLDAAVAAARAAFPGWSATPIASRRAVLEAMADRMLADIHGLKRLLTREQGKPLAEAEGEIGAAAHWLKGTAALELPGGVIEDSADRLVETQAVPLGVVGAIAPWNFPMLLAMFKLGPALLAGNTVVLKPSPFTPLTLLRFGMLVADLLPPGVLNIVTGGDRLGPWLTAHPGVDKVSFTGSTETGRKVMRSAAATLKRITLELGGNDPAIVMPDVDVDAIVPQLFWAAFGNAGQVCIAIKRLYVHAAIYDRLRDALVAYAATVRIGDGATEGTQIGPVANADQRARLRDLIADCKAQGYRVIGDDPGEGPGFFVPVTIVDNPPDDSRIVQEEQFGPVLPLLRFDTSDEAVARANVGDYALGASIWSADDGQARTIAARLTSGTVWINEVQHLSPRIPFGGQRQSGIGLENGPEGLREYCGLRTIITRKHG